jgi:ACS family sodium-dependent inorganic phosphate cotransporter
MVGPWPRRHLVVGLSFLGCVIAYTDRVNISVAAVAMKEHLGWSQTQKGLVLSAFFIGYMLCMFVAGLLATRFGGKRVAVGAAFIWSIFTLLTPVAATASISVLIGTRIFMGMGEAGLFPSTYELFGRWVPLSERARAAGRFMSGIPLGTVIGLAVSAWLVDRYGWPAPFYFFGMTGLVWMLVWIFSVKDDPRDDHRVGADERRLLDDLRRVEAPSRLNVPVRRLLLRRPVFAVIAGQFASVWTLNVLLSWLPSYFRDVQHLSIANAGIFSAAPWLTMALAVNLAAAASDRMIRRGANVTSVRKLMQCGGLLSSAAFMLVTRGANTPAAALLLLVGATASLGITWCGFGPGNLDIAPRHGGVMVGFTNTVCQIPGIVGVGITGWLVDATGTYSAAFALAAAISVLGALVFASLFDARPLV